MRPDNRLPAASLSRVGNATAASSSGGNAADSNTAGSTAWGPFGSASTYGADMAVVVGILLLGFILGVIIMLAVRLYLARRRDARTPPAEAHSLRKPEAAGGAPGDDDPPSEPPAALFSAGKTDLAGAAAECAICLTEFAEGDPLRVLQPCRHGFHLECTERWLATSARSSLRRPGRPTAPPRCPVCRTSFLSPEHSAEPEP